MPGKKRPDLGKIKCRVCEITIRKQYKESSINDVFEVIVNGPEVENCEKICEIAMRNFFGNDEPHFYAKNPLFKESKVLRRLDQVKSSLPFMD